MENYVPALKPKKCCVPGCDNKHSKRHRFPKNDPEIFKMWLDNIRPEGFKTLSKDIMYNRYYVCDEHFAADCFVPGTRRGLKRSAVPTLSVPGFGDGRVAPSEAAMEPAPKRQKVASLIAFQHKGDNIPSVSNRKIDKEIVSIPGPSSVYPADARKGKNISSVASSNMDIEIASVLGSYSSVCPDCPADVGEGSQSSSLGAHLNVGIELIDIPESSNKNATSSVPSPDASGSCISDRTATQRCKAVRGTRKRRSVLWLANVSRSSHLTPKAKILYSNLKRMSTRMGTMQKNIKSFRERLALAEKVEGSQDFKLILKDVNHTTYNFIMCQVRNQKLKSRARRYTLKEKILALSLFKTSGKGYRLLSKIFALPSPRTLSTLLQKIPFYPGINQHIFQNLQNSVQKMKKDQEKLCFIMFDEIALQTNLAYHRKQDIIVGLEDYGEERRGALADHANVFMLKGVYRQWKQPVAFTFSQGPVKSHALKDMIKNICRQCQSIGLKVIATVCDQGSTNRSAINMLRDETKQECLRSNVENRFFGFLVDGQEIIPLYDVPHLFKGLRNNLLNKDLHFEMNGEKKIAKWSHIEQFYKLDSTDPSLRMCQKLTDAHILPSKINKMKVKNCTQVFSNSVGVLMKRISKWDIKDRNSLPEEVSDTADLILFLDKLFDSLNVSRRSKGQAKLLKQAVTSKSNHEQFWRDAIKIIDSMRFFSLKEQKLIIVPSLTNLKMTLRGFIHLKTVLIEEHRFKFMLTGALNQDALENFFSYIRSHGVRYTNPDVSHFISSFKTLVINNFMSTHSPGSNCKKDSGTECLDNLRSFLTGELLPGICPLDNSHVVPDTPSEYVLQKRTKLSQCTIVYMSGAICKILLKLKMFNTCETCKKNLSVRHEPPQYDDFIDARQYELGHLFRPGTYVTFLMTHCLNSLFYLIPRVCTSKNILILLKDTLQKIFNFSIINCPQHKLGDNLCEIICRCCLFWWTKQVNKIANGNDTKYLKFLSTNPKKENIDPIKRQAYEHFKRQKNRKK